MELTKLWTENKKTITTTAIVVVVGMLIVRFFNVILFGAIVVGLAVAAVLLWGHLTKKHGGAEGIWKAFLKEIGVA